MMAAPRPLGALVPQTPTKSPTHKILTGQHASLVPLSPTHADALQPHVCGDDNAWLWDYLFERPPTAAEWASMVASKSISSDPLFFTIMCNGVPAGYVSLMRNDSANRVVEVGNILYLPSFQRSRGSTEVIYLLLKEVFDGLGYRRCEWKCNDLNAPSKRAAERYGFTFEGVFRQHMVIKGRNRDTAWFSMLDCEWQGVKAGFEAWLADGNFDAEGKQIRGLVECRVNSQRTQ